MYRAALLLLVLVAPLGAQQTTSASVVKATVTITKPDADGKETVTITLTIDPKYHLFANPVGNEDLESSQVVASFENAIASKLDYSAGKVVKDKIVGDYNIYQKSATITATVKRSVAGDPIEAQIRVHASNSRVILPQRTIKVIAK